MTTRQNLTISLKAETIRQVKVLAASRGTSVSRLVAKLVQQLVDEDRAYEASRRAALAYLEQGFHLGGRIVVSREELHER